MRQFISLFSTILAFIIYFLEVGKVQSSLGKILLHFEYQTDSRKDSCESIISRLKLDDLPLCEKIPQYSAKLCQKQLDLIEEIEGSHLSYATHPILLATLNIVDQPLIFEMNVDQRYRYLQVFIEIWTENQSLQNEQKLLEINVPWIQIEMKRSYDLNMIKRSKYKFKQINERHVSVEGEWNVFRFDGNWDLSELTSNQVHQIKLMVKNNARVFLESLKISQSNQLDKLQLGCDQSQLIHCNSPHFEFQPFLQACVFRAEQKCPLGLIESVQDHICVDQCSEREFAFIRPDDHTLVCLQRFQTCDQNFDGRNVGCKTCNRFSNICFECEEGYYLNENSNSCFEIPKHNSNSMSLVPRQLYSGNCARPTCAECLGGNTCVLCRSPFVNVHGACVLCGRGTIIDKSTDDWYCRKTTDKLGCSNFNQVSNVCQGCFLGVLSFTCDQNASPCTSAVKFQSGLGTCGTCSDYDSNCQKCATANQCHICQSGYKLAIQDYSVLNPNVICVQNCATGFFEDLFGFCAPCGSNCDSCTQSSLVCSSCKSGFEVDKKYSRQFPTRKERCIPVIRCPVNCISCSNPNVCNSCPLGFTLVNGQCEKCGANCKICSDGKTCIECINTAESPTACTPPTCSFGKYLGESLTCQPCIPNCQSCWNPDSCDICLPGYVMEKNSCLPCPANCSMCYDQNTCVMCKTGYFIYSNGCSANLLACPGQFYSYVSNSCTNCVSNCSACTNPAKCTSCMSGITPILGTCNVCQPNEYYSTTLTCLSCPTNCSICVIYQGCVECLKGYSLNLTTGQCDSVALCGDGDMSTTFAVNSIVITKQCDDKNATDGDGCDSNCQIEDDYTCTYVASDSKSTCKKNFTNRFWLESKTNSENLHAIIIVKFDSSISLRNLRQLALNQEQMNQKAINSIVIDIEDTTSDMYSYTVNVNQSDSLKTIDVEFTVKKNIINKHVQISFLSTFVTANSLTNSSEKTLFPDTRPIDEGDKKIADAIATAGSVAGKSFLITVIPVILFSKFSFLFNALDLFQMIYYLQFVNIRFPYNVSEFLRIMSNFKVPFSLNFIKWFLEANPVVSPVVPTKFTEKQIDGVFLKNAGDHYSQVTIIIVVHLILVVIAKATVDSSVGFVAKAGGFLDEKLTASWQWGWYLDKFWEMFLSIVVGCALQFYGLNSGDFQSAINTVFFIVSVAMILLSPIFFWKKIHKNKITLKSKSTKQKWGMLYEGLTIHSRNSKIIPVGQDGVRINQSNSESKVLSINQSEIYSDSPSRNNSPEQIQVSINNEASLDSSLNQSAYGEDNSEEEINEQKNKTNSSSARLYQSSKYFYVGLYARKIFFGAFIGVLYNFTLTQLILIDSLNLFIVIFLTAVKPYEKFMHGFKAIICELLMITAQFSLKFLIDDPADGDESDRMKIGWVFVGACIAILIVQMVFVLVSLCMDLCKQVSDWLKKRKQKQGEQELDVSESQSVQNAEGSNVIDLDETSEIKKEDLESSNQSTNRKFKSGNKSRVSRLKKISQSSADQQEIELGQIEEEDLSQQKPNFNRKRKFRLKINEN